MYIFIVPIPVLAGTNSISISCIGWNETMKMYTNCKTTGCPRKNYLLAFGIPPACFQYKTASEQYLVTEIGKAEVTDPRNGKVIFRKITTNILLPMCMFMTMERMFVHIVLAKNLISDHLSFFEFMFKIS